MRSFEEWRVVGDGHLILASTESHPQVGAQWELLLQHVLASLLARGICCHRTPEKHERYEKYDRYEKYERYESTSKSVREHEERYASSKSITSE